MQKKTPILVPLLCIGTSAFSQVADPDCLNPVARWVRTFPETGGSSIRALAIDPSGNVLIGGWYGGVVDFDLGEGVDVRESARRDVPPRFHSNDMFVTKFQGDASYGWTYTVGAGATDTVASLAPGVDGSVLLTGSFEGIIDFDPSQGVDNHAGLKPVNGFITRLDSQGGYVWTRSFQGAGNVFCGSIVVDPKGNIHVVGGFDRIVDFDPGPGVDQHVAVARRDGFVGKFESDGSHIWARIFGGFGFDYGQAIVVDHDGHVIVTGAFQGQVDFDPGPGTEWHQGLRFPEDLFVTKFGPDGSYHWTRSFPVGSGGAVGVDADGAVFLTGGFSFTVDFDPTAGVDLRSPQMAEGNMFVTKLNADGSYAWTRTFDGLAYGADLAVDIRGNTVVTGQFRDTVDFDPSDGLVAHTSYGGTDVFLVKLSGNGEYVWSRTIGGDQPGTGDGGQLVDVGPYDEILLAGVYSSATVDLDPGCGFEPYKAVYSFVDFFVKLVCEEVTADFDEDGDVDLWDAARVQTCFTGDPPAECDTDCPRFDFAANDALDLSDFAAFHAHLTGPK